MARDPTHNSPINALLPPSLVYRTGKRSHPTAQDKIYKTVISNILSVICFMRLRSRPSRRSPSIFCVSALRQLELRQACPAEAPRCCRRRCYQLLVLLLCCLRIQLAAGFPSHSRQFAALRHCWKIAQELACSQCPQSRAVPYQLTGH